MNSKVNNGKETQTEIYWNAIMEIIGKLKPEHLKRIYGLVFLFISMEINKKHIKQSENEVI